ncbi:hypothetical protein IFR04_001864 [Cadophora malorum]|uniref:Uncharacterized protein n=1 Tax=Cadophora malorum TaxID=108018 RepID=A0A8H8BVD9_9HELO|nr:hypothetical protein IFR04_001864 [Cadophora malorum]
MVDPFPARPAVAKVAGYIPLIPPPSTLIAINPPPYTGHSQSHNASRSYDPEHAAGDPVIANKPIQYSGNPFAHRPLASQYVQRCDGHHVEERPSITRTILACISILVSVSLIITLILRINRNNNN